MDNKYFRIEHILDAEDGNKAIAEFSAGSEAKEIAKLMAMVA